MPVTKVLTQGIGEVNMLGIDAYRQRGGYTQWERVVRDLKPADVLDLAEKSGLRGRGGAGFPTGKKWSFLPKDKNVRYLVCNCDEAEPGTFKDHMLLETVPHQIIEGMLIGAYGIASHHAFIYIRGEFKRGYQIFCTALAEARKAGYVGKNLFGTGYDLEVTVHRGAGAYICGEETGLLNSLEGKRGEPRLKPPFPAVAGLYACPTVVNNVESIATVPYILQYGAPEFTRFGTERSKGFGLFSLSGHVTTPGQYEAPLGTTLRELLELAGGMRNGRRLKFWTPGGSSTPLFTDQHLAVPLDYESVAAAGSMLGTRSVQLFDDTTCVVRVVLRWVEFYQHESCGKCTPCREGSWWVVQLLRALENGEASTPNGVEADLEKLLDICENITGRSFCALGDSIQAPVASSIKYFRDEYLEHHKQGGCPFDPSAANLFAASEAQA